MVINGGNLLALMPIKNMEPTKKTLNGVSYGLGEAGYDIRIKQTIRFIAQRNGESRIEMDDGEHIYHSYGKFTLASAIEEFDMPDTLMGIVHDKSTWARKGLSVFNTVIEPGWKGFLTLELVYKGEGDLIIEAGSGVAQVIFHELSEPARYKGKYQNQQNRPIYAIDSK
jgi:dCTP deaminase